MVLLDGMSHEVDSSEIAFRLAAIGAFREGKDFGDIPPFPSIPFFASPPRDKLKPPSMYHSRIESQPHHPRTHHGRQLVRPCGIPERGGRVVEQAERNDWRRRG